MSETKADVAPITLRELDVDDAPALVRCFERVYGDSYVDGSYYHADEIRSRLTDGRLRSIVAVAASAEIVGHMGLSLRGPGALTADAGNTVVDPRYRNQKLAARIGAHLIELSQKIGLVGFHHYPTTAHPIMQKLAVQGGGFEMGVMLAYIPGETDYGKLRGDAEAGRLAVVVVYQPLAEAPQRAVFLPERYAAELRSYYDRAGLDRALPSPSRTLSPSATRLSRHFEKRRRLLHIEVSAIGHDLIERVRSMEPEPSADVTQLDLPLSDAGVSAAVEALRRRGFFFAALLPEYADGDVLRLQRLPGQQGSVLPELATKDGRAALARIAGDRATASAATP